MFYTLDSKIGFLVQIASITLIIYLKITNERTFKLIFDFQTINNRNKRKKIEFSKFQITLVKKKLMISKMANIFVIKYI